MAHVLVGVVDPVTRAMVTVILEDEGHTVTVANDFWSGFGVVRSSLHPIVTIYQCDGSLTLLTDEHLTALEAAIPTLRQHGFVAITSWHGPLRERMERLRERLPIETISSPFAVDDLLDAVNRAAQRSL